MRDGSDFPGTFPSLIPPLWLVAFATRQAAAAYSGEARGLVALATRLAAAGSGRQRQAAGSGSKRRHQRPSSMMRAGAVASAGG